MPDGSVVVSGAPTYKKKKGAAAQMAYRPGTFRERNQWAKWAQHEYPIYAELAAERPMITAYNLAMFDIAHPPVIHRVLRKDNRILVNAWDEILVAGVKVTIHDGQGQLVEVGEAVQQQQDWWEYTPKLEDRVSVSVWDIPGNRVRMELEE